MQSKMKWKTEQTENPLTENDTLLQAALSEFSAQSFGEASLNRILKSAQINKGSFYYRFNDKLDLYLSLISLIVDEKKNVFSAYNIQDQDFTFFHMMETYVCIGLKFAKRHPLYQPFWRKILTEERHIRSLIDEEFGEITKGCVTHMVAIAMEKGEIRNDLPIPLVANIVGSVLNGLDVSLSEGYDEQEILALANDTILIVKEGLFNKNVFVQ